MSTALWRAPLDVMTLRVEIAWGADLTDVDGSGWSWTDVTADVRQSPGIATRLGRGDEASRSQPATLGITLDNAAGDYSLGGQGVNWPYVRRGTPVRVRIDPGTVIGGGSRVLFLGYADGFTPAWDAAGAVPTVELSASGALRRLSQGAAPVLSAYRRSMTDTATVVAYWPLEEQRGARYGNAIRGGTPMFPSLDGEVGWASSSVFESSDALPQVGVSSLTGVVTPYTQTNENQVRFFIVIPDGGLTDGSVLAYISTTGTLGRWDIVYADSGTGNLSLFRYNSDGTLNSSTTNVTFDMDGNRRRLELQLTQTGSDVAWWLGVLDANLNDPGGGISGTILGKTVGIVSQVQLAPLGQCSGTVYGHVTVQNDVTSTFEAAPAYWAWQRSSFDNLPEDATSGDATFNRLFRLCGENDVFLTRYDGTVVPDVVDPMLEGLGPQTIATLLDLLGECETVDQGQLWDGRTAGLAYTNKRYRETGRVALTLDASGGQLGAPFAAVDDDQRTRNKVTVTRTAGASATVEDSTGAMGTQVIGIYDTSVTANAASDGYPLLLAGWLVALGTVAGYRTPTLTIDLRVTDTLAGAVLDLIPGDRVQVPLPAEALAVFPTPTLDLIVEGIAHQVDASGWRTTLTCSPFTTWGVARIAADTGDTSGFLFRPDTDGSTLAAAAVVGQTTLSVATASGPLWTTTTDDFPLTLDVGGVPVVASGCSGSSSPQTFTVAALTLARSSGRPVALWDPRPLGL